MSNGVSCKDVCLSWSKIVLLISMCIGVTEKPTVGPAWILPCCSHGAFAMELMFDVFTHSSFTQTVSSEPLLKKVCSSLAKLLLNRLLYL